MDYKLRQSTEHDYEFCYDLTKRNMYDLICRHWGGWVDAEFRRGFEAGDTRIIMVGGKPAGYFCCKIKPESIYIDNIQILPSFQGQGLGTSIVRAFMDEHQYSLIRLATFEDNPAKKLYGRLGFVIVEKNGSLLKMEKAAWQ